MYVIKKNICSGLGAAAAAGRGEAHLQRAEQAARQDLQQDHRRQRGGNARGTG